MRKLIQSNLLLIMFLVGAASGFLVSNAGWWGLRGDAAMLDRMKSEAGLPLERAVEAERLLLRADALYLDALRKQKLSEADARVLERADDDLRALLSDIEAGAQAAQWQQVAALHESLVASRREALAIMQLDPAEALRHHSTRTQVQSNHLLAALHALLPDLLRKQEQLRTDALAANQEARQLLLWLSVLASVFFCLTAARTWRESLERRRQSAARDREHTMFRTLFQASNDGVILLQDGRIVDLNRAALALFAVPPSLPVHELGLRQLQPESQPDDGPPNALTEAIGQRDTGVQRLEWMFRSLNGREFPAEVAVDVARLESGSIVQLTIRDITRRREAESSMRLANHAFENSLEGIAITDAHGNILTVNGMFTAITGYDAEEVIGRNPSVLSSGRQTQEFYEEMWRALNEHGKWQGEVWNKRKNGELYPQWLTISRVTDGRGRVTNFVGVFSDITERKSAEERILRQIYYDQLTDLPNRTLFNDRLSQVLSMARRHNDQPFAVMFIDLDRFKLINDTMGHQAGDQLLQQAAHRLRGSVRESDTVARMSGDEFTVLLAEIANPKHAANVAQKILDGFRAPFQLGGEEVYVSPSIGISVYPDDGRAVEVLLKNADMAMYRAKAGGGSAYELHDAGLAMLASERLSLETALHKALDRNELELHYQPQFDCDSGKLHGFEALLRWRHPERGLLMPETFLLVAEESGLIVRIGEWVLREACARAQAWRREYPGHRLMAVNLSSRQFHSPDLLPIVRNALHRSGLPPFCLELEITEGVITRDLDTSAAIMKDLTEIGVQFSIDDFGTGHSSLSLLKTLPIHALKVDESFIRDLDIDEDDASIVNAIVVMAGRLGLRVVAEGVEQQAQLALLKKYRGVLGQGVLLGSPLTADDATRLLAGTHHNMAAA